MTAFSGLKVEIEFTAGNWTDVSSYISENGGQYTTIQPGRPTPFDDIVSTIAIVSFVNDDGRFIPDNGSSTYFPNFTTGKRLRISVVKSAVTYLRFTGYMTNFDITFPSIGSFPSDGSDVVGNIVTVTCYDAISILALRKMNSFLAEKRVAASRSAAVWGEYYLMPQTSPATYTDFSVYANAQGGTPGTAYVQSTPPFPPFASVGPETYGLATEGGLTDSFVNTSAYTANTSAEFAIRQNAQSISFALMTTAGAVLNSTVILAWTDLAHTSLLWKLTTDSTTGTTIVVRNSAGTIISSAYTFGPFYLVEFKMNSGTNTSCDFYYNGSWQGTFASLDVRSIKSMEFGGGGPAQVLTAFYVHGGGVSAFANDIYFSGTSFTVASILTNLSNFISDFSPGFLTVGNDTALPCFPGYWQGIDPITISNNVLRAIGGFTWVRTDGTVCFVATDATHPLTPLLTIDSEADAAGLPVAKFSDDLRPTRVPVTYGYGKSASIVAIDAVAETTAPVGRRKDASPLATTLLDSQMTKAFTIGFARMLHTSRTRFTTLSLDLLTPTTDYTSTILSTAGNLGALYPTQRIRVNVPSVLFGSSTKDYYVYGWTETYGHDVARIDMDLEPACVATVTGGTCVGNTSTGTVIITSDSPFTTVAQAYPMDFDWAGERITLSTPGGATSPQTFTCTARGVTGGTAAASHSSGTSIDAWIAGP